VFRFRRSWVFVLQLVVLRTKSMQAKKHVFGSSVDCRGGGYQTFACVLGIQVYELRFALLCVRADPGFGPSFIFFLISFDKVTDFLLLLSSQWSRVNVKVNVFRFFNKSHFICQNICLSTLKQM
jgi:hypothetical protein